MTNYRKIIFLIFLFCIAGLVFGVNPSFAEEKLFEIRAKKFAYTPHIIKVNKGDVVRIRLISEDVHHGFFLDGYGIKTSAHPGQEGSLKFIADKAGRFSFRCSVTCGEFHPYMVGYLVVGPNSRFSVFVWLVLILSLSNFLFVVLRKKRVNDGQQQG